MKLDNIKSFLALPFPVANFLITVEPITFVAGDDTATQTATTEDTRGTILCTAACNGSVSYEVYYQVNTSDLHGIEQYNG